MAVTSVTRLPNRGGSWNRLWQRTYETAYRVECDSRDDGPYVIRTATSGGSYLLPRIGDSYYLSATEQDAGSYLVEVTYQLEHGQLGAGGTDEVSVWNVACKYGPYDATTFPENPVEWPVRLSFSGQKFERVLYADRSGNPIRNSAKSPFADPVVIDDSRSIIRVTRNELISSYDEEIAGYYRDSLNLTTWNGYAAETVKCHEITTSEPQYNSVARVWYFAVTYVFEYNQDGWKRSLLDQGFTYLDGSSPAKAVPITYKGQPITDPQLLDGSGHVLATTGTPVFIDFDVYKTREFSAFNINFAVALGR